MKERNSGSGWLIVEEGAPLTRGLKHQSQASRTLWKLVEEGAPLTRGLKPLTTSDKSIDRRLKKVPRLRGD